MLRAVSDPVIVHSSTQEWETLEDNQIHKDIKSARLKQNLETPTEERVEYATWPETTVYFSTLSMDSKYMGQELETLYHYAFTRYLDEWTDHNGEEQPEPSTSSMDLSAYQIDRLDDLRFGIKKDRDKYFIDEVYDTLDLESVPKEFWLTNYELERSQNQIDDFAASAITDIQSEE